MSNSYDGLIGLPSSGSSSSRCHDGKALQTPLVVAKLANAGVFIAIYLIVFVVWILLRQRRLTIDRVLPWYTYGLALMLSMLAFSFDVLWICLFDCSIIHRRTQEILEIVSHLSQSLAQLLVLGIALVSCTIHLLNKVGHSTKIASRVSIATFTIVCALFVPMAVLSSMSLSSAITANDVSSTMTLSIQITYRLAALVTSTIGAVLMAFIILKAAGDCALSTTTKVGALKMSISLVLINTVFTIQLIGWALAHRTLSIHSTIIFETLENLLAVLPVITMLAMATSMDAAPNADDDAEWDADQFLNIQRATHKSFSYVLENGKLQPQIRHSYNLDPVASPALSITPPLSPMPSRQNSPFWSRAGHRLSTIHSMEIASPVFGEHVVYEEEGEDKLDEMYGTKSWGDGIAL